MSDLLVVGDVHVADGSPGWRTESYKSDILDKLVWIGDTARSLGARVVFTGDLFHSKRSVSFRLINDLIRVFAGYPSVPGVVVGNHDVVHDRVDKADESPIGVLAAAGSVVLCCDPSGGVLEGFEPGVVGFAYSPKFSAGSLAGDWGCPIAVMHFGLTPEPFPYATVDTSSCENPSGFEFIVAGHIHDDLGVWQWGSSTCVSLGSISRGSWTSDTRVRIPRIAHFSFDAAGVLSLSTIEVPVRPVDDVFRVDEVTEAKAARSSSVEFARALSESRVSVMSSQEVVNIISRQGVEEPVKERASEAVRSSS